MTKKPKATVEAASSAISFIRSKDVVSTYCIGMNFYFE